MGALTEKLSALFHHEVPMATKDDKHALYLINPDTDHVELIHADDVDAKKASGWKEPTSMKPNGQPYNQEEDFPGQDGAAESARKMQAIADKKAADAEKSR
jgi:hypothetical protein